MTIEEMLGKVKIRTRYKNGHEETIDVEKIVRDVAEKNMTWRFEIETLVSIEVSPKK